MKKFIFSGVLFLILFQAQSQDQYLSNPGQSLLYTNPSFAGSSDQGIRDQFVYRNQWPNLSGNYVTVYNGTDVYVKALRGGIAVSGMQTDQGHGEYRNSNFNLIYAPRFECRQTGIKIIPSIQLSYLQVNANVQNLPLGSGFVSWTPGLTQNSYKSNFAMSTGLLFNCKNFYLGASVFHINQPDVGLGGTQKLPARFSVNTSYNWITNDKTLLNFSIVGFKQRNYGGLQLGANAVLLRHIVAGVCYLSGDEIFMNLGYRNNFISATAGYGRIVSKISGTTAGIWQLSCALNIHRKEATTPTLKAFEKW